jgi:hypothetical protein
MEVKIKWQALVDEYPDVYSDRSITLESLDDAVSLKINNYDTIVIPDEKVIELIRALEVMRGGSTM